MSHETLSIVYNVASIDTRMLMERALGWPRKRRPLSWKPKMDLFHHKNQFVVCIEFEEDVMLYEVSLPLPWSGDDSRASEGVEVYENLRGHIVVGKRYRLHLYLWDPGVSWYRRANTPHWNPIPYQPGAREIVIEKVFTHADGQETTRVFMTHKMRWDGIDPLLFTECYMGWDKDIEFYEKIWACFEFDKRNLHLKKQIWFEPFLPGYP